MPKVILFNGPRSCGKGIAVEEILSLYKEKSINLPCKEMLMTITQKVFGISEKRYWEIYNDRNIKELPMEEFRWSPVTDIAWDSLEAILNYSLVNWTSSDDVLNRQYRFEDNSFNLSIREAIILVSECIVKPNFGKDYLGKVRAKAILQSSCKIITDDSCGFCEELIPLFNILPKEDILLIRVHREGYTFQGDSRNYLPYNFSPNTIDVYNNGSVEDYLNEIREIVLKFVDKKEE